MPPTLINFTLRDNQFATQSDSDDVGSDADVVSLIGPVKFIPQINRPALGTTLSPQAQLSLGPIDGYYDTDGQLKNKRAGTVGVRVPANDPVLGLTRLPYRAVFGPMTTPAGDVVAVPDITFDAPATDTTVWLPSVAPVPGATAGAISKGDKGDPVDGVHRVADTLVFEVDGADIPSPVDISDFVVGDLVVGAQEHNAATNLLIDGSYKKDATWWAAELFTGKTLSTTQAFNGTQSLKITGSHSHHPNVTSAGQAGDDATYAVISSEGGRVYRYSCRIFRPSTNTSTGYFRARIACAGGSGEDLVGGYGPEATLNQTDMPTNTWFEYTNWFWVPYTGTHAPYAGVFPQISTETVDVADVFYIDDERFEDVTNSPPELVAPPPTGDRTTDTKNVQRLVNLAQNYRGTVVLREGTYAADIVTQRTYRQPRIVGQGKQLTFIDGTIKMRGTHDTADGNFSGGWLEGFTWTGSHAGQAALELAGVSGVHGKELFVRGTYDVGILFHNELSDSGGDYTETCSFVCDFYKTVDNAVRYKVTAGQASFHGSGLEFGSNIQGNLTHSAIYIDTNARPYNAPMSARIWTSTDAIPIFQHYGQIQSSFLGNLAIEAIGSGTPPEGTGMWIAAGDHPVYFGGSLNTYLGSGVLDYGVFRLMSNVEAQGGDLTPGVAVGPTSASRILDGNGATLVDFGPQASAVNYIEIDSGATGHAPAIYGWGSDTNVDLFLSTKGTGKVYVNGTPVVINTRSVTTTAPLTGGGDLSADRTLGLSGTTAQFNTALSDNDFMTLAGAETGTNKTFTGPKIDQVKDANGHLVLDLPAAANAVNYFELDNAPTGLSPTIYAWGSDSNIHLNLATKGSGLVKANDVPVALRLSNSAALNFPSVSAQSSQDLTITVTGAATGDCVALGVPTAAVTTGIVYSAWVSATDTVTVRAHNYTAGALDPASGTFKAMIVK